MSRLPATLDPADLDLHLRLRAGDRIVVAQGPGEPATLTHALADAAEEVPDMTACVGLLTRDVMMRASALAFESYGALGHAARLPGGALTVLDLHYSDYIARLADGRLAADVLFIRLSAPDDAGVHYLGMGDLHLIDVARRARLIIAEINPATPRTRGTEWPHDVKVHLTVKSDTPELEAPQLDAAEEDRLIADHVAELVPDRAVLQLGVGRLPDTIAKRLGGHRDLGVHSGALTDAMVALSGVGALTNAAKEIDTGLTIGGTVIGSRLLCDHIDANPSVHMRPTSYTHSPMQLGRLSRFHAINSAIEVDLLGQINTETAKGRRIGGIGGQVDFTRGAQISGTGRAIVVLPSTASKGAVSRIVPSVETVTLARADADTVVTEWGVAELRGAPPSVRSERLIAIADPRFREDLSRFWHDHGKHLHG